MLFGGGNEIFVGGIIGYVRSWVYGYFYEFVVGGGIFVVVVNGWFVRMIIMGICCYFFGGDWYFVGGFVYIDVDDVWLDV